LRKSVLFFVALSAIFFHFFIKATLPSLFYLPIPNDSSVEIHEASGKASSIDAYDKLIRYCRSEISIALLGQDQTTEKDSTHASATAGLEVTDDIRDSDKRIVETTFNQLIEWVVEINFGDVARPKFVLFENEESGTRERAERDKMMVDAGAKFTNQYWQRTYGLREGDLVEDVQATPEAKAADFTEGDLTDAGLVIDGLAPDTGRLNEQGERLTAVLVSELRQGETAENLLDRLTAAYRFKPLYRGGTLCPAHRHPHQQQIYRPQCGLQCQPRQIHVVPHGANCRGKGAGNPSGYRPDCHQNHDG